MIWNLQNTTNLWVLGNNSPKEEEIAIEIEPGRAREDEIVIDI